MSYEAESSKCNGKLEEYRALRTEIMYAFSSRVWGIASYLVMSGAMFVFWANSRITEVFLIPIILAIPFILRLAYSEKGRIRISTYIAVFLENEKSGLAWEKHVQSYREKVKMGRFKSILEGWLYIFAVLGVYDIVAISCLYFIIKESQETWQWVIGAVGIIGVVISNIWLRTSLDSASYYRRIWENLHANTYD